MERQWEIIPQFIRLEESVRLSKQYGASFEYNDFYKPSIYQDEEEIRKRIEVYKSLDRDRSKDTLHGVFFDIAMTSTDDVIRDRSRYLMKQSMDIARELGCKGVVFHTGILAGLWTKPCLSGWVTAASEYLPVLARQYPEIEIYIENTFERDPSPLIDFMERLTDCPNIKLCLDYAHASLTVTDNEEWVKRMAPYLGHMHTNDNDLIADLHQAPGRGSIDYQEFKRLLDKYDVHTSVLLELDGIEEQEFALKFMQTV